MQPESPASMDEMWRQALLQGHPQLRTMRHVFRALPASPRCVTCNAPFKGAGGLLMRLIGRPRSTKNPRYCEPCAFQSGGGAEVEISMLFADVRGSTTIAEGMRPADYTALIERFYREATDVLVWADALIDRLMGDQVIGLFAPGFAGPQHALRAVEAARELQRRTGLGSPSGVRLPIGIGVHTGVAFVGIVEGGPDGMKDFTLLGDNVNVTARLASTAGSGEILVSDAAYEAAGLVPGRHEHREFDLKGKSKPVGAYVIRAGSGAGSAQ